VLACYQRVSVHNIRLLFNNSYFLVLTSVIVVTGNFFFNRLRLREFTLRFELDKNKQMLEESNNKLRQLDEVKSRFFANISHELRTPLTLLLAPLETLIHRFSRSLGEDGANLLVTMQSNGMRLLKLINDLLDLVRLESGVMVVKREPLDVADFIKGLASAARQMADDKRIKLETVSDPEIGSVMADRDKLEKIILNLQFNALKFTPAGGRVELRAAKDGDQLVLSVKDTGMGISQKNLPHVFDRFWQADDSSRRKYQGVGIGLALVRQLVQLHGGTISAESDGPNKGARFTVRLPLMREAATPVLPSSSTLELSVLSETNFLIVDDSEDTIQMLQELLKIGGGNVMTASNGTEALRIAREHEFDVILSDISMPEMDGFEFLQRLREIDGRQDVPVVAITGFGRSDDIARVRAAGFYSHLTKPLNLQALAEVLQQLNHKCAIDPTLPRYGTDPISAK